MKKSLREKSLRFFYLGECAKKRTKLCVTNFFSQKNERKRFFTAIFLAKSNNQKYFFKSATFIKQITNF